MRLYIALATAAILLAGCDASLQESELAAMTDAQLVEALAGVQSDELPSTIGCRAAQVWVEINPSLVPHTLDGLREIPSGVQRAALGTLQPEIQVQVWQQHLSEFTNSLTRVQARELTRIRGIVTAEWLAEVDRLSEKNRAERIEREIGSPTDLVGSFGDLAPMIFTSIQSNRVTSQLQAIQGDGSDTIALREEPECTCAQSSDWCDMRGHNSACQEDACGTTSGCGTLWQYSCNGECLPD